MLIGPTPFKPLCCNQRWRPGIEFQTKCVGGLSEGRWEELVRGGAPGAVWDSATDLKSGRLFDFSVGLKNSTLPPTAQFFKMYFP